MSYFELIPEIKFSKKEQIMDIAKTIGFLSGKKETYYVTVGNHVYDPPVRKLCLYYNFDIIKYLFSKFEIDENSDEAKVINKLFMEEFHKGEQVAINEKAKEYVRLQSVGTGG